MSYYYNDETNTVKYSEMPKLTEEEAEKMLNTKPNKKFLAKIAAMKLNIEEETEEDTSV